MKYVLYYTLLCLKNNKYIFIFKNLDNIHTRISYCKKKKKISK